MRVQKLVSEKVWVKERRKVQMAWVTVRMTGLKDKTIQLKNEAIQNHRIVSRIT